MQRTLPVATFLALLLAASCGPPWQVIRQATPNPLLGQRGFRIAPLSFAHLMVGDLPEPAYLARKDPGQRGSWDQDKAAMANGLIEGIRGTAEGISIVPGQGQGFVIEPEVTFIEPGYYAAVVARSTEIQMIVRIRQGGAIVDEIQIGVGVSADLGNPSVGGRLRTGAARLGGILGRYLVHRTSGQAP